MIALAVWTILIPFFGTALGATAVFLMKRGMGETCEKILSGFAAGVMIAASVWSLLLPAIERSARPQWLWATIGFVFGVLFLIACETISERWQTSGVAGRVGNKNRMLIFAVTLHNLPEGMAVGVALAGALCAGTRQSFAAAMVLAVGIAVQNIPEGAIISMPLAGEGHGKAKAFLCGVLSGVVEPIGAALTLLLTAAIVKLLPLLLAFAAGAMVYVCVNELIPAAKSEKNAALGAVSFSTGFLVMMILDVALG